MTPNNCIVSTVITTFANILTYGVRSNTLRNSMQNKALIAKHVFDVFENNPKPKKTQEKKNILGLGLKQIHQIHQIHIHKHERVLSSCLLQLLPFSRSAVPASREIYRAVDGEWVLPGSSVFDPPEGTRGGEARVLFCKRVFWVSAR